MSNNKIEKDTVIIVIASRSQHYDNLINIYWKPFIKYVNSKYPSIKIYLIFGQKNQDNLLDDIKENIIEYENVENYIPGILIKTVLSFEYINNNYNYKKILRTNLSSFLIIERLIDNSNNLPNTDLYAGVNGHHRNIDYCSGAGFWCSKDVIEYMLKNKNNLNYSLIDDVSVGLLLSKKYNLTKMDRYDLVSDNEIKNKEAIYNELISKNTYHIRIKSDRNKALDYNYMHYFLNKFYSCN